MERSARTYRELPISRFTRTQQFSTRGLPFTNSILSRKQTVETLKPEQRNVLMAKTPHELKLVQSATNAYINKRQQMLQDRDYLKVKSEERSKVTVTDDMAAPLA